MPGGPPLLGLTVVDLSSTLPGPYCSQLLADLGARVIKVERPGAGDPLRELMPAMFAAFNRGKRSVTADLKEQAGRDAVLELAAGADVVIEGFRPGVATRLGVGPEAVRGRNSRAVYCSISGAGATGPLRDAPGHDVNYLGRAGALTTLAGEATETPFLPYADLATGALAAVAVLAALRRRDETGEGAFIDLGMLDVSVTWALSRHAGDAMGVSPAHTVLRAGDGRWFTLGAIEDHFWDRFAALAGDDRLLDARFATHAARVEHGAELTALLEEVAATRPADAWLTACDQADVPAGPVAATFDEVLDDAHQRERGIVGRDRDGALAVAFPARWDGDTLTAGAGAPGLGSPITRER